MACIKCLKILLVIFMIILAKVVYDVKVILGPPPVPKMENTWWGVGKLQPTDSALKPFKISVSDEVLKDLKTRLENHRPLQPPLEGIAQEYGMNSNLIKAVADYWKNKYNWREREAYLNQFPQFTTNIQGLKIHYLHVKPKATKGLEVLPLLLSHGWPGSVREFYEIIPILTTPQKGRDYAFEVIVPSVPGYGFSEGAVRPGLGPAQIGVIFKNLMNRLGFQKFFVQGGDWGSVIVQSMGALFPRSILGVHSNLCIMTDLASILKLSFFSLFPSLIVDEEHQSLVYPLLTHWAGLIKETGYFHIQATKPDTVGLAVNESPIGLAAYILEKFTTGTNHNWKKLEDGGLTKKYTLDALLDNVMIYWITNSFTTSARIYAEYVSKAYREKQFQRLSVTVPSACAQFKYDLAYTPKLVLEGKFTNLLQLTDHDGGHFAAFEVPEVLAEDIFNFTDKAFQYIVQNEKY